MTAVIETGGRSAQPTDPFAQAIRAARSLAEGMRRSAVDGEEAQVVEAMLASLGAWAKKTLDSAAIEAAGRVDRHVFHSAAGLGLFGLSLPRAYGGAELSLPATARIVEELAIFDPAVAVAIGLHCGLGSRALVRFGTEPQKARYLPALAAGELIAAFAATEPGAGSHIAGIKTTADRDGGGKLRLNGEKCFITNGGIAGVFTVFARTPGLGRARRGASLLLIPRDLPGVTVGWEERKLGLRGSSTTSVRFDNVEVNLDDILGEPAKGLELIEEPLIWGRTLMAAGCIGMGRKAYRRARAYALERRQFGKRIGSFELIREKIARMRALLWASECVVGLTTMLQARVGADIRWESAVAKVLVTENVWRIADEALQVHGGSGYMEDTGIPAILRNTRIGRIFEGTNEVLRLQVGLAAIGFADRLAAAPALVVHLDDGVRPLAERFDAAATRFAATAAAIERRYGIGLQQRQLTVTQVADAAIALFALLAVVLRTSAAVEERVSGERTESLLDLASYAATRLERSFDAALDAAVQGMDEGLVFTISESEYDLARADG